MKKIFSISEVPFILSLLFVALGYQLNTVSDDIKEAPSLEYTINTINTEDSSVYIIDLKNITNDKSFRNLGLNILLDSANIINIDHDVIPPSSGDVDGYHVSSESASWHFKAFQPGDKYSLKVIIDANTKNYNPRLFLTADENTVQLVRSSPYTWIIEHSKGINLSLIALWIILIVLYFVFISKRNPINPEVNEGTDNS